MHDLAPQYYVDFWPANDGPGVGKKQKMLVFDPNAVIETNYKVGCYESFPILHSGFSTIKTESIKCMHLHDVGLSRKLKRYEERKNRMSKNNLKNHLSDFYLDSVLETTTDFFSDLKRSKRIK